MRQDGQRRNTSPAVRARAKMLRTEETPAERMLWRVLRDRAVNGLKFRRQHPLDGFVLDFFCAETKLCVELDGGIHDDHDSASAHYRRHQNTEWPLVPSGTRSSASTTRSASASQRR